MTPDVVVDIGNSRIKWGRSQTGTSIDTMVSLAGDDPAEWDQQLASWQLGKKLVWAVAGVQPQWQKSFMEWVVARGGFVQTFSREQIPIPLEVENPESVGIDRLLNAVAASRLKPIGALAIVIGVGTAVTVDLVQADGAFAGGTIFPGPRLMSESLHRFTAKLPLVELNEVTACEPPGKNTYTAIEAGISNAILGGAALLVERMAGPSLSRTYVILTGGGLGALANHHFRDVAKTITYPTLTLDGIRIAAESMT